MRAGLPFHRETPGNCPYDRGGSASHAISLKKRRCRDIPSLHLPLTYLCNLKPTWKTSSGFHTANIRGRRYFEMTAPLHFRFTGRRTFRRKTPAYREPQARGRTRTVRCGRTGMRRCAVPAHERVRNFRLRFSPAFRKCLFGLKRRISVGFGFFY